MDTTYFDFGKAFGHVSEGEQSVLTQNMLLEY